MAGSIRTLNVPLAESEYDELAKAKGDSTWRVWLLEVARRQAHDNKGKVKRRRG
jgi:hypothetical protein